MDNELKVLNDQPSPFTQIPMCKPHLDLLNSGKLEPLDNCFACIRNERDQLKSWNDTLTAALASVKVPVFLVIGRKGWRQTWYAGAFMLEAHASALAESLRLNGVPVGATYSIQQVELRGAMEVKP